ncbi:MAG: hypothetical protein JSS89_05305 [Bacteroidetes bacterium]|nr:hypothetical protein [Bacteroidota bacterium]
MSKSMIDLAYERLNHELSIHWTRINITWLIVTASFTSVGFLLYQIAISPTPVTVDACRTHHFIHLLSVMAASSSVVASVVWRSIIVSGNIWVQVWEQKIGILEYALERPLYLELDGKEMSIKKILGDYSSRSGVYRKDHPSITVAYSHLSLIAIVGSTALLLALVVKPNEFGIIAHSDWRHYGIMSGALLCSVLIEWPIAVELRRNNRIVAERSVARLIEAVEDEKNNSH